MKRQIATLIGVLGLLLVAAGASAQNLKVTADVPFNFEMNQATMPAGAYTIRSLDRAGENILLIAADTSRASQVSLANSAESLKPSADTRLVFHRYGGKYFLSQIWVAGERYGREFSKSRHEVEMAKNIGPSEEVIVLAALR